MFNIINNTNEAFDIAPYINHFGNSQVLFIHRSYTSSSDFLCAALFQCLSLTRTEKVLDKQFLLSLWFTLVIRPNLKKKKHFSSHGFHIGY